MRYREVTRNPPATNTFDGRVRIVALENLRAMCRYCSGICHRYRVEKVTRSRVHVAYSNPDEYGSESPVVAVYPVVPNQFDRDGRNPYVLIGHLIRTIGGTDYDSQSFGPLEECPHLWRNPATGAWGPGPADCARAALDSAAWYRGAVFGEREESDGQLRCRMGQFIAMLQGFGILADVNREGGADASH